MWINLKHQTINFIFLFPSLIGYRFFQELSDINYHLIKGISQKHELIIAF